MTVTPKNSIAHDDNIIDLNRRIDNFMNAVVDEYDEDNTQSGDITRSWQEIQSHAWIDAFDPAIQDILLDAEKKRSFPAFCIATTLLTIVASLMGDTEVRCKLNDFNVTCNLYSLILIESGSGKSPTDRLLTMPLRLVESRLKESHKRKVAAFKKQQQEVSALTSAANAVFRRTKEASSKKELDFGGSYEGILKSYYQQADIDPDNLMEKPVEPVCWVNDATPESIAKLKRHNGRWGYLLKNDEAKNFFLGLGAYSKNGAGLAKSYWVIWWDGTEFRSQRASEEEIRDSGRLKVSLALAGQPVETMELIKKLVGNEDHEGFYARFLVCMPPPLPRADDDYEDEKPKANDLLYKIYNYMLAEDTPRLGHKNPQDGPDGSFHYRYTKESYNYVKQQVRAKMNYEIGEANSITVQNLLKKTEMQVAKVAGVMHVLNHLARHYSGRVESAIPPYDIDIKTVKGAVKMVMIHKEQAKSAWILAQKQNSDDLAEPKILRQMKAVDRPMSIKDLVRKTGLSEDKVDLMIQEWLYSGKVVEVPPAQPSGRGRPGVAKYQLTKLAEVIECDA